MTNASFEKQAAEQPTALHPIVKDALLALDRGDSLAWSSLFEANAELWDDGEPRSLKQFTREALGHERFTSIEKIESQGLGIVGSFHSEQWGEFRTYFRFQLGESGKIKRLEIGQAE